MNESLLDTDILSYYLRGDKDVEEQVKKYLSQYSVLNISLITCFEVLSGLAYKEAYRQMEDYEKFLLDCNVFNISDSSIRLSATAAGFLRRNGITIGNSDLLIAGIALENDFTLITNNVKHFEQIPDLKIENWKRPINNFLDSFLYFLLQYHSPPKKSLPISTFHPIHARTQLREPHEAFIQPDFRR